MISSGSFFDEPAGDYDQWFDDHGGIVQVQGCQVWTPTIPVTSSGRMSLPFRAKRKIPAIKKTDNYLSGHYTFFPAGNPVMIQDFSSPVVNWLKKTRS